MSYRHPRYHSGPDEGPIEAISKVFVLVLVLCGCFAVPLLLLGLASEADSAPCATLSDKSDTICLERLN